MMDAWSMIDGTMDRFMDGWSDAMGGWVDGWVDGLMILNGWVESKDGAWSAGWIDGDSRSVDLKHENNFATIGRNHRQGRAHEHAHALSILALCNIGLVYPRR